MFLTRLKIIFCIDWGITPAHNTLSLIRPIVHCGNENFRVWNSRDQSRDLDAHGYSRCRNFGGSICCSPCVMAEPYILQQVSDEVSRKCPARNMMVQLSTPTPTLSATIHSVTDRQTDRMTDDSMTPLADHTAWVVGLAKKSSITIDDRIERWVVSLRPKTVTPVSP